MRCSLRRVPPRSLGFGLFGGVLLVAAGLSAAEPAVRRTIRKAHTGQVTSVAFSPDGKTLASGSMDSTIKLWSVESGKSTATFDIVGNVTTVAFSPNGKILGAAAFTSAGSMIELWSAADGKPVVRLPGRSEPIASVVFSPDGKSLASGSYDGTIQLLDVPAHKTTATLENSPASLGGLRNSIHAVVFSPDGKSLAAASRDGTVKLWDVAKRQIEITLKGHTKPVFSVAFSPDGKTVASGGEDKTVRLWDVGSGRNTATFRGHTDGVASVAFSPDGKSVASGSLDDTVRIWDVSGRTTPVVLEQDTRGIHSIAFRPDGKALASGGEDGTITLWDLAGGKPARVAAAPGGGLEGSWLVLSAFGRSDGTEIPTDLFDDTVIAFADGKMTMSGRNGPKHTRYTTNPATEPPSIDFEGIAPGRGGKWLGIYEIKGEIMRLCMSESRRPASFSMKGADNWLLLNLRRKGLQELASRAALSARKPTLAHTFKGGSFVTFTRDGKSLISSPIRSYAGKPPESVPVGERTIEVRDAATRKTTRSVVAPDLIFAFSSSPDGTLLAAATGRIINLWGVATGQNATTLPTINCNYLAFSADGKTLAATRGRRIELWNVLTGKITTHLSSDESGEFVNCVAFSPDGKILAAGTDHGMIELWDTVRGENTGILRGHGSELKCLALAFSGDGKLLASGSEDRTVKVWDVGSRENSATFGALNPVNCLAFGPDGRTLAAGTIEIRLWDVRTGQRVATLRPTGPDDSVGKGPDKEGRLAAETRFPRRITSVSFSPDGETLASGGEDRLIRLWNLSAPAELPAGVAAGEGKAPEALPETVRAPWEAAGFTTGWISQSQVGYRYLQFQTGHYPGKEEVPAFSRKQWQAGLATQLPQPERIFGLYLRQSGIDDGGMKELARFKQLHTLDISNTRVTDLGLKELAGLTELRRLSLDALFSVSDAGLKELAGLKRLQMLNLGNAYGVTDRGLKELAGFKQLRTLDLTNTKVTDAGLKELAELKQLKTLSLGNTKVTDAGLKELAGLKQLESLTLNGTKVTDAGLKELAGLKQLESLLLISTHVDGLGLKDLAGLQQLKTLSLGNTKMTDAGLKELAKFRQLEWLDLTNTEVTDAGLKELAGLTQLWFLGLENTKVTETGVRQLQRALPRLKISYPIVKGEEVPVPLKEWEFKAVLFGSDEKEATKKLDDLASQGWQYVGPLGNSLVAFRRHYVPMQQIVVEVAGRQPRTPAPGEKVAIAVTVRAGDRSLLAGAKVTVAAGGGSFLTEAGKPIDPKDRGDHPNSVKGITDANGQFTTWWIFNTGPAGFVLGIEAAKKGYISARADYSIHVKP